jgi:dipeptidyl aminopeptidase/acylaminoacyl peptidase
MRALIRFTAGLIVSATSLVAQRPPEPDIFLAPLTVRDGHASIGSPVNITRRAGYDNQPSFTPDSRAILFTSTREDAQSDIYRYDLATTDITRVTSTPESEYSATVMPGGKRFSVIRVERDSTQRLWSFALDGSDPRVVVESLKPVGYHVWLDADRLAMFVLGNPNALVLGDLRTGKLDTLTRGIGRSLLRLPDGSGFSFTQNADSAMRVRSRDAAGTVSELAALPRGSQDIAWLSNGTLLTGSGSKLVAWEKGAGAWRDAADFSGAGITQITRLAVSPDGKWIAIVAVPKTP